MALKGNQKKLDKNNNNRIDAQDFKILKAEKAKGRGMGLQDEKMKPGKVMKANKGKSFRVKDDDSFSKKMELQEKGVIDKKTGAGRERITKAMKATSLGKKLLLPVAAGVGAYQFLKSKMKKDKNTNQAARPFPKKMGGGMMKKYNKGGGADTGTMGEARSKLSTAIDAFERRRKKGKLQAPKRGPMMPASAYEMAKKIKDKDRLTNRDIDLAKQLVSKKMGGGMMMKPTNYNKGSMIKARGGGIARIKPTKMY